MTPEEKEIWFKYGGSFTYLYKKDAPACVDFLLDLRDDWLTARYLECANS